jgi:translation elongation factor P/translation initiation factor 5A
MKKQAKEIKPGDKLNIAGQICKVLSIEMSEIGKQGKRKCRIKALTKEDEEIIIVRPEDYPFEIC